MIITQIHKAYTAVFYQNDYWNWAWKLLCLASPLEIHHSLFYPKESTLEKLRLSETHNVECREKKKKMNLTLIYVRLEKTNKQSSIHLLVVSNSQELSNFT